jgi:hypothetical protein
MKAVRTAAVVTALIIAAGASASGSTSLASHRGRCLAIRLVRAGSSRACVAVERIASSPKRQG